MTIPNAADDVLYDGIKGPTLQQATVNVSQQIINRTNGLSLMKPRPKDRDGSLFGGIKGPNPLQTTAKANRKKSKGFKVKRDDMTVTLKVLHCSLLFTFFTFFKLFTLCYYPVGIVPLLVQNEFC